MVKKQRI